MNLRSSRLRDMDAAAFNMPQDYFGDTESSQAPSANAVTTAVTAAGLQAFGWDDYYTSSNVGTLSDSGFPVMYPSPRSTSTASDTASQVPAEDSPTSQPSKAPKRKRENRYKNAPPAVLSRRRAQNRASQRAYRERKEQRIRDLEVLLDEAHRKQDNLSQAYQTLRAEYEKLQTDRPPLDGSAQPSSHHAQLGHHAGHPPPPHPSHQALGMDFASAGYGFSVPVPSTTAPGDMMGALYVSHPPHPLPLPHQQPGQLSEYPPPPR